MRCVAAAVSIALVGGLTGCSDALDNALGVNGDPSQNIAMQIEGEWIGHPIPGVAGLVDCLQKDVMSREDIPQLSLLIKDGKVTGAFVFADGARFDFVGRTRAGARHTGQNQASGDVLYKGREVGYFSFDPDGFSGRLRAEYIQFDRPDTGGQCRLGDVVMTRKK